MVGPYREVTPGIVQNTTDGNVVLFIDEAGRGLLIDPDPCIWIQWEEACRGVHAELDLCEREFGLKRVEIVLITHYHGDHAEYAGLLRERYGAQVAATPDVAVLLERPKDYRYPFTIDWYNVPPDHIDVDRRLPYDETLMWNDVPVTPIHTPSRGAGSKRSAPATCCSTVPGRSGRSFR